MKNVLFDLEEDHRNMYKRNLHLLCGMNMKQLKWTTDLKIRIGNNTGTVMDYLPNYGGISFNGMHCAKFLNLWAFSSSPTKKLVQN